MEESKIGLINVDEVRYTGSSSNTTFENYYFNNIRDNAKSKIYKNIYDE